MPKIFNLPSFVPVNVACGKPAKGEKIQYRLHSVDISGWSDGQLAQWLSAGLANITGDRLAGAAKESNLEGLRLIEYKAKAAKEFLDSLAGPDAFPGRKASATTPKTAKASPIPTLESCIALIRATFDADDMGMSESDFDSFVAKSAPKMRAQKIREAGRNPETYDSEEEAKRAAKAGANASPSDDDDSDESNGGAE